MARPRKPWYRKAGDAWYVEVAGKQVFLAKGKANKAEALLAFHRLMAAEGKAESTGGLAVRDLCNLFLARCERELAASTFGWYLGHLEDWVGRWGDLAAPSIKPLHVSRWLEGRDWSDSTRRGAITAVKACWSWAAREGHLAANPLARVERPPMGRRRPIHARDASAILETVTDQEFRDYLTAIWETGCRPGEVWELTADRIDLTAGTWTVRNKTARRTGKVNRTIVLTPTMVEISRRLMALHPEGPIFRNTDGGPWNRNAIRCRFRRLKTKLGIGGGMTAYAFRHRYATDAVKAIGSDQVVAELMGHAGTRTLSHYAHMDEELDHLKEVARLVRPDAGVGPRNNPSAPGISAGPKDGSAPETEGQTDPNGTARGTRGNPPR